MNARNLDHFASDAVERRWLITVRRLARPAGVSLTVLVSILALLVASKQTGGEAVSGGIASLADLGPPERAFEGRLNHFPYRPRQRATRGKYQQGMMYLSTRGLSPLVVQIAEDAKRRPSPSNLHALGVAYLTIGKPDQSLAMMTQALIKQTGEMTLTKAIRISRDTTLLNDFAVAAIAAAKPGDADVVIGEAIEATHRARQLKRSAEIAWNRAAALEKLGLDDEALIAWRDYLTLDKASSWANEALKSVRSIEAKHRAIDAPPTNVEIARVLALDSLAGAAHLAELWPSACRSYVEDALLPALIEASGSGDMLTVITLSDRATKLSRAAEASGGDTSFADVAKDLAHSLLERPRSNRSRELVAAVRLYLDGKAKYRNNDVAGAVKRLSSARDALRLVNSPLSEWAAFYLACCSYYANAYDPCLTLLLSSGDAPLLQHGWKALVANRTWVRALALGVQNRRSESIVELERAEALFHSLGERDNVAAVASLLAEVREYLGDRELAAKSRRQAISALALVSDTLRRGRILNEAVEAAVNKDLLWTAFILQDKAVEEAVQSGRTLDAADAFMWRGLILARLFESQRARADFERAAQFLPLIEDKAVREKTAADLAFCKATVFPYDADWRALDSAAAFYRHAGNRVRLSETYRLAALAAIHRGALDEGEALLRRSVKEIRFGEQHLADPASKLIYAASASQVASAAAQEFLKRSDDRRAFALLEDIRSTRSLTFSISHLALPNRAVLLFYFIGDEMSYVWVVRGETIQGVRLSCRRSALLVAADVISDRLARDGLGNNAVHSAAASLYDALIAPIAPLLDGAAIVAVVPDDAVANVPFPALQNRLTGRYFVQDELIVEAPSAAAFADAMRSARNPLRLPVKVATVLVSDPTSNGIAPLPELRREVAAVREVAQSVRLFGMEGAEMHTSPAAAVQAATLLHFAGHGEFDASSPADSALIVGGSRGGAPTRLSAREIVRRSPSAKLVVLAACDSGRTTRGVPAAGVAQWLVAVGVTSVIATISPVDDAESANLVRDYYRQLKGSPDSAAALRSAQIAAIKRGDNFGWPAFIHFGAPRRIENGGSNDGER